MQIELREYQKQDFKALETIIRETWHYDDFSTSKTAVKLARVFLSSCLTNYTFSRVAVVDGNVAGIILANNITKHKSPLSNRLLQIKSILSLYLSLIHILEELTKEEIIERISEAGVVGMGGAGFPTKVKLSPKEADKIEYIIANGAECEPYITADYRRMMECTREIVSGMEVVLSLFPNAEGIFAVEDNKKDCVEKLKEAIAGKSRMSVKVLETKYPQGAERQLIYATTKRAIHAAMLPADAGCIVDNVETLIAINQAVRFGKPLMERVVTVSGDDIQNPGNFRVPIGMNHRELVDAAGGFITEPQKLISGGPMMGFAMVTLDAPVTKTSSSILAFQKDEAAEAKETACINCGRCVEVCPSRIIPSRLADLSERHNEEGFVKMNGLECVECGSCSFVCPAKRNLKQAIGSMRKIALANKRK